MVFEEGYDFENPKQLVQQIFPKNFHFIPEDLRKTQKFYEFLLVDSDSCEFKHYEDKNQPGFITHSTFHITKILSPFDWGSNPNQFKKNSQNFDLLGYNY